MGSEPTFSRNPDVVFRQIEGGGVLLNTKTGSYHEVNSTARQIWNGLESPATLSDLVDYLGREFPDAPDLESDITAFIGQLTERGLVVEAAPSS